MFSDMVFAVNKAMQTLGCRAISDHSFDPVLSQVLGVPE
jgi:hypothetical protein